MAWSNILTILLVTVIIIATGAAGYYLIGYIWPSDSTQIDTTPSDNGGALNTITQTTPSDAGLPDEYHYQYVETTTTAATIHTTISPDSVPYWSWLMFHAEEIDGEDVAKCAGALISRTKTIMSARCVKNDTEKAICRYLNDDNKLRKECDYHEFNRFQYIYGMGNQADEYGVVIISHFKVTKPVDKIVPVFQNSDGPEAGEYLFMPRWSFNQGSLKFTGVSRLKVMDKSDCFDKREGISCARYADGQKGLQDTSPLFVADARSPRGYRLVGIPVKLNETVKGEDILRYVEVFQPNVQKQIDAASEE